MVRCTNAEISVGGAPSCITVCNRNTSVFGSNVEENRTIVQVDGAIAPTAQSRMLAAFFRIGGEDCAITEANWLTVTVGVGEGVGDGAAAGFVPPHPASASTTTAHLVIFTALHPDQ